MTAAVAKTRLESILIDDRSASFETVRAQSETMWLSEGTYGSALYKLFAGGAGVSEAQAMRIGAVYAAVALLGGAVAALPFHLFERTASGRQRYNSDLWWLFNESPSTTWTSAAWWQFAAASILLKGDGFAVIERASAYSPRIIGFTPAHPDAVQVLRQDGRNRYSVVGDDHVLRWYDQDDILHFSGVGFNGLRSITPIRAALGSAASLAAAADNHAEAFFRGGARPDHAIVVPREMKVDEAQQRMIRETWSQSRERYTNTGMPPLMVGGMDVKQLSISSEDAQLLETRQQSVEDIARIMGVPAHMIGKTDKATSWGTGVEQMSIGFVRYTLRRHLDVITQEINRKVWPRSLKYFGEFSTDALLEGDAAAQAAYFGKALGGPGAQGWMSVDEVRRLKNMPPTGQDWSSSVQQAGSATPTTSNGDSNENANA